MLHSRELKPGRAKKYSISIDVPDFAAGLAFYRDALGLVEVARPVAAYVILKCGDATIGLIEKQPGTKPAKGSDDVRRYERHWTPVHIDFHLDDFDGTLARVLKAGAICEQTFAGGSFPPTAFCSDPFGPASASSARGQVGDSSRTTSAQL